MDLTALEAALDDALATAGVVTSASSVVISRERPQQTVGAETLWLRYVGAENVGNGAGSQWEAHTYEGLYQSASEDVAQSVLQTKANLLRQKFSGLRNPASIDGLFWVEVETTEIDRHPDEFGAQSLPFRLTFHGSLEPLTPVS